MTPANGKFLLDTNIVIALFRRDPNVRSHLARAGEAAIPVVALGELFWGAAKSGRRAENWDRVEGLAAGRRVIGSDLNDAREYGRLKHELKAKGTPLPENDIWIAARATITSPKSQVCRRWTGRAFQWTDFGHLAGPGETTIHRLCPFRFAPTELYPGTARIRWTSSKKSRSKSASYRRTQEQVLRFVTSLAPSRPVGEKGTSLLKFAYTLDAQSAREMSEAIEEEFGRVDAS